MRITAMLLAMLALTSCATRDRGADGAPPDPAYQAIVDRVAANHRDVARLSIHAVPSDGSRMTIVASTAAGRIGEPSDAEDLDAARSGRSVVLREAHNLDYTEPVADASGRTTAVIGVTISGASGASDDSLVERARQVAAETASAIRSAR